MTQIVRIVQGDTVAAEDHVVTLAQAGVVVDLTGCTVKWKTRARASSTVAERAMTNVGLATTGKVTVAYTAVETAALALGEHVVQVEVTTTLGGAVRTFPGPTQEQILMIVSEGL